MPSFKHIASAMLLALVSASTLAYAEGEKLVEIRIQGNRRIESAAILNVVKMHAGDIAVDSREGRGTTFTVSLPVGSEEPREGPGPAARPAGASGLPAPLDIMRAAARPVASGGNQE